MAVVGIQGGLCGAADQAFRFTKRTEGPVRRVGLVSEPQDHEPPPDRDGTTFSDAFSRIGFNESLAAGVERGEDL